MKYVYQYLALLTWLAGVVLAKGFWSTLVAFIVPFWAWYLVIEQVLVKLNFVV
jgi:hypothetical protein